MTKLMEWLAVIALFVAFWLPLLIGVTPLNIDESVKLHVWLIPVYLLLTFGIISAIIVMYRVITFNDCPEAYEELIKQIAEAKHELTAKGIVFDN